MPSCRVWSPQPPSGRAALDSRRAGGRGKGMMNLYQLENDAFWGPGDLDRDNVRVLSCLKTLSPRGISALACITPKNSLPPNAGCQKKVNSAMSNNPCARVLHLVSTSLLKLT